jgi:hypothetical protein
MQLAAIKRENTVAVWTFNFFGVESDLFCAIGGKLSLHYVATLRASHEQRQLGARLNLEVDPKNWAR